MEVFGTPETPGTAMADPAAGPTNSTDINDWVQTCFNDGVTLRTASFRGVPFFVEQDDATVGRRIVTHELPNRDDPLQEDLGQKEVTFKVKGYIYGGMVEIWKDKLLDACAGQGPADLILPYAEAVKVVCAEIVASRSKDKLGWFDVSMQFRSVAKRGISSSPSPYPTGAFAPQLGAIYSTTLLGLIRDYYNFFMSIDWSVTGLLKLVGADQVLIDLSEALSADTSNTGVYRQTSGLVNAYSGVGLANIQTVQSFVSANAIARIEDFCATIIAEVEGSPLLSNSANNPTQKPTYLDEGTITRNTYNPPSVAELVVRDATALYQSAATYIAADPDTGTVRVDHMAIVGDLISKLGACFAPRDAEPVLKNLCAFSSRPPTMIQALSDIMDANNEFVFAGTIRRLALVQLAQVYCAYPFVTRSEAIQARADLSERFYQELVNLGPDSGVGSAMISARDTAIKAINQQMTTLAGVVFIDAAQSLPALYWAFRLYSDPTRAEELADRNEAFDPLFLPASFEALSK
jgi:prophage DNA circulation protein